PLDIVDLRVEETPVVHAEPVYVDRDPAEAYHRPGGEVTRRVAVGALPDHQDPRRGREVEGGGLRHVTAQEDGLPRELGHPRRGVGDHRAGEAVQRAFVAPRREHDQDLAGVDDAGFGGARPGHGGRISPGAAARRPGGRRAAARMSNGTSCSSAPYGGPSLMYTSARVGEAELAMKGMRVDQKKLIVQFLNVPL